MTVFLDVKVSKSRNTMMRVDSERNIAFIASRKGNVYVYDFQSVRLCT